MSNNWNGAQSFEGRALHDTSPGVTNPYAECTRIVGEVLEDFVTEQHKVLAYGFGDAQTQDQEVFPIRGYQGIDNRSAETGRGHEAVLERYLAVAPHVDLKGPTSFAPLIELAMEVVQAESRVFHTLVILTDGHVTDEERDIQAICEASMLPIAIVVIGIGDGPWDDLESLEYRIPPRRFDNWCFVSHAEMRKRCRNNFDAQFAQVLLEKLPEQFALLDCLPDEF